ncbi:MAG TPA: hypothetical protein DHV48_06980 [Prolixibacteraceae bacterium]|nr:hypothetical protein [Prolixibacteraceae bacterium]
MIRVLFSFFAVILLNIYSVNAQQVESLHSLQLGYPGARYCYEYALGNQFTINMEAGINIGWQKSNINTGIAPFDLDQNNNQPKEYNKISTEISFRPIIQLEPRIYYNVKTRHKYDSFINNSASFFCISSGISLDSFSFRNNTPNFFIVPKWGFRRSIGNHFIFEAKIGGGLEFRRGLTQFEPGLDLKFGYVF